MATLTVRKLDDNTYNRLQSRASDHGISMEEEARRIFKTNCRCTTKHHTDF